MTARLKILLTILVAVVLVDVGIFWHRSHKIKNQEDSNLTIIEAMEKEIKDLNKELDRMLAEADITIGNLRRMPIPNKEVKRSYHDGGYENSWIQDIDKETGLVLVTGIVSKMSIVFKPAVGDLQKFHIGWLAPVTFHCTKLKNGKCDFKAYYTLFVSNGLVEVKQLNFPKK